MENKIIGEDITPAESIVPIYLVPLTSEEEAEREKMALEAQEREAEEQAKIDAKESAITKLSALGLTEEEARAIIGI